MRIQISKRKRHPFVAWHLVHGTTLCGRLSPVSHRSSISTPKSRSIRPSPPFLPRLPHSFLPQRTAPTRAAHTTQTRRDGELRIHCVLRILRLYACVRLDSGCASPMQVMAQKTKEAEITEQDSLLLVSFLLTPASIPCNSSGFRRLRPIESLLLVRDVLLRFLTGVCTRVSSWGFFGSNWGRFEHRRARYRFAFPRVLGIFLTFTRFVCGF